MTWDIVKRVQVAMVLTMLFLPPARRPSLAADQAAEKAARKSAEAWLALIDSAHYAESWDEASPFFKEKVARDQWVGMVESTLAPFGKLKQRTFIAAKYMTELPGAPDGEYVVIQFQSSFEKKEKAVETITPKLAPDGKWRVSGYFVR